MQYKIFVLAPNENWIVDRMVKEWITYNEHICVTDPNKANCLWLLASWCWNHIPEKLLREKHVIATVHHIDPIKFDDKAKAEFLYRDQFIDAYHVPNDITKVVVEQLTSKPVIKIGYWYDPKTWKLMDEEEKKETLQKNQIYDDNHGLIIGSFQRDTEGNSNLPKLAKGPDILCEQIERLTKQQNVIVTLGGYRRGYIANRLDPLIKENKVSFFNPTTNSVNDILSIEHLRELYNILDVYLVTSRYEGGPQAILEAAAMKIPILSTDVGMARDVLCDNCIVKMPTDVLRLPTKEDIEMNFSNVQKYDIRVKSQDYINMFEKVIND